MNRLNLITLGVRDLVRARDFFRALGFITPSTEPDPKIVFFDNRGSKLALYPLEALAEDIDAVNPPPIGHGFGGVTVAYNAKSKDEVDDIFARVVNLGGTIVKPPQATFWGGYSGYFQDLDGYYWEVAWWDQWEFDQNDMLIIK